MRIFKLASVALPLVIATSAAAQYHKYDFWEENYQVQGLLGVVQYENLKFDAPEDAENGEAQEIDVSLLPQFGGAWMTKPKGERFQLGLECSFLLGVRFDNLNYAYLGGNGAYISISTSMWTFDLAGGGYASYFLDKGRKVRIYVGGGPLMNYANYRSEEEKEIIINNPDGSTSTEIVVQNTTESAFGLGLYARTGMEFRIHYRGTLGLGVRGSWSNVDFTEFDGGSSDLVGLGGFITYTAGF